VRFGVYELDARAGELRKGGVKVRLQEQPLQILTLLLDRPGAIVTREEICKKLWPNGTFVDFDHSLNAAVMRLREALDDSADNPRFIETVPRRGYRFLCPLEGQSARRRSPRSWWIAAGFAGVGLAALTMTVNVGGLRSRFFSPKDAAPKVKSVAVLPFKNLMNDPQQDYFVAGLRDQLVTELSKIRALRVQPRPSKTNHAQIGKSHAQIAEDLGVDALISGSVLRESDRVRITVEGFDAGNGGNTWTQSFDRDVSGILALTGEVVVAIVNEMRLQITPQERKLLAGRRVVNPQAFDVYLKGWQQYSFAEPGHYDRAIQHLEEASRIDPSFAAAAAGLAIVYSERGWFQNSVAAMRADSERASVAALRAIELDDTRAEPHAILASVRGGSDWDWAAADSSFQRALELNNPPTFTVSAFYQQHLRAVARFDESLQFCLRGREADPTGGGGCPMDYYLTRDYERALKEWQRWVKGEPKFWAPRVWMAFTYLQKGMHKEALATVRDAEKLLGNNSQAIANAGHVYGRLGLRSDALRMLKRVEELAAQHPVALPVRRAIVYAGLGDHDKAFALLEEAFRQKSPYLFNIQFLPSFEPLRSDPRYHDLKRRMNFPD
jgi:TolB-like protein/DNA-binding winged helix-turn-helix (wHTH) protein/tetratricopeptide (TPR) repeat protein